MSSAATRSSTSSSPSGSKARKPPRSRKRVQARRRKGGRPAGQSRQERRGQERARKEAQQARRSYKRMKRQVLSILPREEVERLARECGFYRRTPRGIMAFEFALCCALAAVAEGKRGFASVWRMLMAAANIKVARSAVTQRFGEGSARLLEELYLRAVQRLPDAQRPETLAKLDEFRQVLAHDGTVLTLSPLLAKLFPGTRTNNSAAGAKLHATADVIQRRIQAVDLTGERESELEVVQNRPIMPDTLYMGDLGFTCYDYFANIKGAGAHLIWRVKSNANPVIVGHRRGVFAPARAIKEGLGLQDLRLSKNHDSFDIDARFPTRYGAPVVLRVVGIYNRETGKHHCYVTTLDAERFTPHEVALAYSRRWIIELLFKLLKSSCHLDHVDTSNPDALRTHIYASLLAATILSALCHAAAQAHGLDSGAISPLVAGIAAPIFVLLLLLVWLERELSREELADCVLRVLAFGCRDQNPGRTRDKWGGLGVT